MDDRRPRVFISGFSVFPGAPANPTERLIEALQARVDSLDPHASYRFEVFDVAYESVPRRLAEIAAGFEPDIAIHFGLAAEATGFRLERRACNARHLDRPDQSGFMPAVSRFLDVGDDLAASLPLEALHDSLSALGLPVAWSDDAGGYLCNYLFYLSCGGHCGAFRPKMAGFIHVPLLAEGAQPGRLTLDQLIAGADAIIDVCIREWLSHHRL